MIVEQPVTAEVVFDLFDSDAELIMNEMPIAGIIGIAVWVGLGEPFE